MKTFCMKSLTGASLMGQFCLRKRFLVIILAILCPFFTTVASSIDYSKIADHPRLLMKKGEEKAIMEAINKTPELQRVYKFILDEANSLQIEPNLVYKKDGRRILGISRTAIKRIFFSAFAYRMTGDRKYALRAEQEMRAVCAYETWNPSHFLDVGEMTMAVAIGYDWLFDVLQPSTKELARKSILEKGFKPSLNSDYNMFLNFTSNWNQVCNTGLSYGALATMESNPKESREIIDRALSTITKSIDEGYAPDGNYPEGYNYWGYGTSFNVFLIAGLESALGTDAGLSKFQGFLESAYFMLFMAGVTDLPFNFSDSGRGGHAQPALFWFANRLKDSSVLWTEMNFLKNPERRFSNEEMRFLPIELIYGSKLDLNNIQKPKARKWIGNGKTPVALFRTDWEYGKGLYLGVKGGSPSNSHSHMDGGSFVFESDGVRWAIDLGGDHYDRLEKAGVDLWNRTQEGQRWDLFRYNNKAHSTLTVNNKKHLVKGNVTVSKVIDKGSKLGVVMDMTTLFEDEIKKAEREYLIMNEKYLQITDNIKTGNENSDLCWTMVTPAEAELINDHTVVLSLDGKKLRISMDPKRKGSFKILDNEPEKSYESKNPGTYRVVFNTTLQKNRNERLRVKLEPCK